METLDVKIIKIHRLPQDSRVKAFVDLGINDALLIKGVKDSPGEEGSICHYAHRAGQK